MTGPDPARPADSLPEPAAAANWPDAVHQPGSPGFERSVKSWLFDLAPPRCRYEDVLHRRTLELARLVRLRLEADTVAMHGGLRALVGDPVRTHGEFFDATELTDLYRRERDHACDTLEQVKLVERCLTEVGDDLPVHRHPPVETDRIAHIPPQRAPG
ncbi:MAG: hypothetical protein JO362_02670 [Streptomycetaceae bacterium]|nr:hypothetical protein [Streptomycetaceae bacterium]